MIWKSPPLKVKKNIIFQHLTLKKNVHKGLRLLKPKFAVYVTFNPSHVFASCMSPGGALIVRLCGTNISANFRDDALSHEINDVTYNL